MRQERKRSFVDRDGSWVWTHPPDRRAVFLSTGLQLPAGEALLNSVQQIGGGGVAGPARTGAALLPAPLEDLGPGVRRGGGGGLPPPPPPTRPPPRSSGRRQL